MDRTVVVYADEATQLGRLMARDVSAEEEVRARIRSQMPVAEKARLASYVIDNSGSRAETERQVREVYGHLLEDLRAARLQVPR
jgi:dephospho-CoA kinase